MEEKHTRELVLVVFFAIGYIAFLVLMIYMGSQLTPPYHGPPRTPVFEHVMPWGY